MRARRAEVVTVDPNTFSGTTGPAETVLQIGNMVSFLQRSSGPILTAVCLLLDIAHPRSDIPRDRGTANLPHRQS